MGLIAIPARALPAHLTSCKQDLSNNDDFKCGPWPRKTAGERGYLGGLGRGRGLLWQPSFLYRTYWVDNRESRRSSSLSLDVLGRGQVQEVFWLSNLIRPAGYEGDLTAETVSKLCQQWELTQAVEALGVLVHTDYPTPKSLFYTLLKQCMGQKDLSLGRRVHALTVKQGYEMDTFLCNHILRMYASRARLREAMDVFTNVSKPDAFTWSAIICAHVQHGQDKQAIQLYHRMRGSGVKADGHVFVAALQACARGADLKAGQQVHADVLASDVEPKLFVWNCLVDMYAKCGSLEEAHRVFDGLHEKDVVTWTAMIAGYSQQGMGWEALHLYRTMQENSVVPNSVTFVSLLQACASVGSLALGSGRQLHAQITDRGYQAELFVGSSLVNMYAKCGSLEDAQRVFDELPRKDVVTWNALIAGYAQKDRGLEALSLYRAMQDEGNVAPNSVTFVCLLQACGSEGEPALEKGKQLHVHITEQGLQADVSVANSLVNMYAKCGSLEDAQGLFCRLPKRDVGTWNAMIAGYSQKDMGLEALRLYRAMQEEGLAAPDRVTFVCLLQACANVAALHLGRQLHAQVREQGLLTDVFVASSLINMYAKSGSMFYAQQVFDMLPEKDEVTWNALISGYTSQGASDEVFDLLQKMREDGKQPTESSFTSVLTVCSHTGLVNKGQEYFKAVRQYGITRTVEHYTCMVDLLGRAGQVNEALTVATTMPVLPDAAVWSTLLAACRKWGNVEVGRRAFDEAVLLNKEDATPYVLMSNIYAGVHMWEQAMEMQARRTGNGAWKQPGQSWWTDTDGVVHSFRSGNYTHPLCE